MENEKKNPGLEKPWKKLCRSVRYGKVMESPSIAVEMSAQ